MYQKFIFNICVSNLKYRWLIINLEIEQNYIKKKRNEGNRIRLDTHFYFFSIKNNKTVDFCIKQNKRN